MITSTFKQAHTYSLSCVCISALLLTCCFLTRCFLHFNYASPYFQRAITSRERLKLLRKMHFISSFLYTTFYLVNTFL
ncbi:hypothetical protein PUN28_010150 [Cardiocondyla obscurior]|uniref:Uncharacterized protein n=1 Tax=Cardiocondyla obscurior TaxID=286306 RepID=A0AAW2FPQ4_9HYME